MSSEGKSERVAGGSSRHRLRLELIAIGSAIAAVDVLLILAGARFLRGRMGDFAHFYYAARSVAAGGDIHNSGQGGYIYPPLLAFLFQPLAMLSLVDAAVVWTVINAALLVLATVLASRDAIRRFGVPSVRYPVALVTAGAFLLTLDKTRATLNMGQTDCLVLLGFVLGLIWLDRRPLAAGLALGMAANIKYLSLICVPYLLLRRRWAAAFWTLVGTIAWAMLPAISLGWDKNGSALQRGCAGLLSAVGIGGEVGGANISDIDWERSTSLTSAISRAVGTEAPGEYKLLGVGAAALAVLGAAWWIYWRRGQPLVVRPRDSAVPGSRDAVTGLEWSGLIVAALAFGPQTTARHLVLLLAVHAMVAAILLTPRAPGRKWPLVAGVVLLQLGLTLPPGGERYEDALQWWRSVGGASGCMVVMFLALLWAGLPPARSAEGGEIVRG